MKKVIITIFLGIIASGITAQPPSGQWQGQRPAAGQEQPSMNIGHFSGRILDDDNGKSVEGATVQLSQIIRKQDSAKSEEKVLALVVSDKHGDFSINKLPLFGKFTLLITAVGYSPDYQEVSFDIDPKGDRSKMMSAADKDLGNIKLNKNVEELQGVVITAEKPKMQMGIDRKVYNVDQDISSAGGTAVDVMKNVPSVNVDIDGNVTLRNQSPQLLVDGRPTTLTLDQIPAEEIESVEIITNPSAKFDASGGGAGILNVILKKNRKPGYNGNLRTSADTKGSNGLGGDLNVRQGKFNFFGNVNFNQRKSDRNNQTLRLDHVDDLITNYNQDGRTKNNGHFTFGRAGFDYLADNRNTYSLSGLIVDGKFNNEGFMNILRDTTLGDYFTQETGLINTNSGFSFKNKGGAFGYKHNFAKPNANITADINYSSSKNTGLSLIGTQYFDEQNNPKSDPQLQTTLNNGQTKRLVAQTDFSNPINDNIKIEAGLRAAIRNYNSSNENFLEDLTTQHQIPLVSLNSKYKFNDQVYAGYATYSQKLGGFSYQLGGRVESSFYSGKLIDSNQIFRNDFPFSFFPSVFLTQKINDKQDVQLNYSRKINRPNFFQLIPYYDFTDSLNISRGNPDLKPEFTDLLELSYQNNFGKGNNFLATLYYRNTNDLITRYVFRDKNPNTALGDSIFISSFTNASSSSAYGLELTSMNRIASWWDLTSNVNLYNNKIDGSNLNTGLTNSQWSWFGKINSTFKIPSGISIQITGDYTSKTILPPARGGGGGGRWFGAPMSTANGYMTPVWGFDAAVRKDFLKDKALSLSLSVNDIFATRINKTHSVSDIADNVFSIQDNRAFNAPQIFRLSVSWRFGKMDTSLFKRKNMKADQDSMQGGMEGIQQ